ncbi:MAG: fucose isomerase [Chloroflexi bacterium]|nr:MAG: fucose isomerase [Chloroflexota bacterium]
MNPSSDLTLGFIAIARPTFDIPLAEEVTRQARETLTAAGLSLVGPDGLVTRPEEAEAALQILSAQPVDLLVLFQATFADSSMALTLARQVDAPLLLWAVPEARTGGRLRLNSLCGINLAGHGLTRAGYHYHHLYAAPDSAEVVDRIHPLALAGHTRRRLKGARLGRLGEHPAGFDTCSFNGPALKQQLGVEVVQFDLPAFFRQVRQTNGAAVEQVAQRLGQRLENLPEMEPAATRGSLATYLTLKQTAQEHRIDGFAVRCWPEFFTDLGCAACGAMSMMSDEQIPCSCEADVNGTITQLILQSMSGEPAFGADLVSVDEALDAVVLWHCGLAPLSMADPGVSPRATIHSNRKLPLLMEFPLKPGRVTVARLSEATGTYRLVVGGGEIVQAPPSFSGTSGVLRFDRPAAEVLNTVMQEGLEHHISITYGDYVPALLALAEMLRLPVLRL